MEKCAPFADFGVVEGFGLALVEEGFGWAVVEDGFGLAVVDNSGGWKDVFLSFVLRHNCNIIEVS